MAKNSSVLFKTIVVVQFVTEVRALTSDLVSESGIEVQVVDETDPSLRFSRRLVDYARSSMVGRFMDIAQAVVSQELKRSNAEYNPRTIVLKNVVNQSNPAQRSRLRNFDESGDMQFQTTVEKTIVNDFFEKLKTFTSFNGQMTRNVRSYGSRIYGFCLGKNENGQCDSDLYSYDVLKYIHEKNVLLKRRVADFTVAINFPSTGPWCRTAVLN